MTTSRTTSRVTPRRRRVQRGACVLIFLPLAFAGCHDDIVGPDAPVPMVSQAIAAVGPGVSPIARYSLDGDASEANNPALDGTVLGATPTEDRFGNPDGALLFAAGEYVETPVNSNVKPLSFSVWFRADDVTGERSIVDSDIGGRYGHSLIIGYGAMKNSPTCPEADGPGPCKFGDGTLDVQFHNGAHDTGRPIKAGEWYHAVVSYSSTVDVYLNGELILTQPYAGTVFDGSLFRFGRHNAGDPQWFVGAIDDVRFFNVALTQDDVTALFTEFDEDPDPGPGDPFGAVSAGGQHTCGLTDGTVACWGRDDHGQASPPAGSFLQVSAGANHSCALRADGVAVCWGANGRGQAQNRSGVRDVSAGLLFSCAVRQAGGVTCWGADRYRQVSNAPWWWTSTEMVSAGGYHACALRTNQGIFCWGQSTYGQIKAPLGAFKQVSAGRFHSCAIDTDDAVVCWGRNNAGQVSGTPSGVAFRQVSAGGQFTCGVARDDARILCWGGNAYGQADAPAGAYKQVSAGSAHACGITINDVVACWGADAYGQAGGGELDPPDPGDTPTGTDVIVSPNDERTGDPSPVSLTFGGVTYAGTTTVTSGQAGDPGSPPPTEPNFRLGVPPLFFEIETTATFEGAVRICIAYDPSQFRSDRPLTLLHYDGNRWLKLADTSIDKTNNVICGTTSSFSPFMIAEELPVVDAFDGAALDEGDTYATSGTLSGPDPAGWTATVDYGDGSGAQALALEGQAFDLSHAYADDGTYTVTVTLDDGEEQVSNTATVTISNVAPSLGAITAPLDPVPVGTEATISVDLSDPGTADTHAAELDWDANGAGLVDAGSAADGTAGGSHVYQAPGVYAVAITVTDDDGGSATTLHRFIVVYDPSGGFVTGGGWIDSPSGACLWSGCAADGGTTGKATFGFVSRYKKGADVPDGNTEFQFKAGGLHFRSSSYDWLVVAGARAQFKGAGTIGGSGDYGFLITAVDSAVPGGGDADRFRIKIWDRATGDIVYDNQMGSEEDSDAATALGGGSVVIHNK